MNNHINNLIFIFSLLFFFNCYSQEKDIYKLKLDYPKFGEITFYITFEIDKKDSTFFAYTNPKSLYRLIPFYKKWYLQLFGKGKKNGAVLRIKGTISDKHLNGKVISYLGKFQFSAVQEKNKLAGTLSNSDIELTFKGKKVQETKRISDYNELYQEILSTFKNKIYNPEILNREDWKEFLENMEEALPQSNDDLDVILAWFYYIPNLKTSHVYLTKADPLADISSEKPNYSFKKINPQTAYLNILNFALEDRKEIRDIIAQLNTQNLIIDLRNCSGGDFSSLLLASHFIDKERYVGYFLGNKYYKFHEELPSNEKLHSIDPFIDGTLEDFFERIDEEGILVGKVKPSNIQYNGKIYLLTSSVTASAAEPLCYFMKQNDLATLIGETTSGQMLSAKSFNVFKDWYLTLPVANYYTIDDKYLDQVGVEPNILIPAKKSMEKALSLISHN